MVEHEDATLQSRGHAEIQKRVRDSYVHELLLRLVPSLLIDPYEPEVSQKPAQILRLRKDPFFIPPIPPTKEKDDDWESFEGIISVLTEDLQNYDKTRTSFLPVLEKGHHLRAYDQSVKDAMKFNLIPNAEKFWKEGLPASRSLCNFVARQTLEYFVALKKGRLKFRHEAPELAYHIDVSGKYIRESWEYILKEAKYFLDFFRSPGTTKVFYSAFEDRRCGLCLFAGHCNHSPNKGDIVEYKATGQHFDIRDARRVTNYHDLAEPRSKKRRVIERPRVINGEKLILSLETDLEDIRRNLEKFTFVPPQQNTPEPSPKSSASPQAMGQNSFMQAFRKR